MDFNDISTSKVDTFFAHHGIKGQKWGLRRFQNSDGTLTPAGRERYLKNTKRQNAKDETKKDTNRKNKTVAAQLSKYRASTKDDTDSNKDDAKKTSGLKLDDRLVLGQEYTLRDEVIKKMIEAGKKDRVDDRQGLRYEEEDHRKDYKSDIAKASAAQIAAGAAMGTAVGAATMNPMGLAFLAAGGTATGVFSASITAAAGGVRLHQGTRANKRLEETINEINSNKNVDSKTKLKLIQGEHSAKDDMAKVNPGYKNFAETTKSNCALCTTVYDLRRRGYDVTANGSIVGYDNGTIMSWYKNPKLKVLDSKSSARAKYRELEAQPEGARGNLTVRWAGFGAGGHSMVYEIENGKPIIRDCQTNKVYKGAKVRQLLSETERCEILRTDNLEINVASMRKAGVFYDGTTVKASKTEMEKTKASKTETENMKGLFSNKTKRNSEDVVKETFDKWKTTDSYKNNTALKAIERAFKAAKSEEALNKLYDSEKIQTLKEQAADSGSFSYDDVSKVILNSLYNERMKELKHSDSPGITFNDILAAGESIEHSGIKGQKWGLRRFQYNDGSLTPEGRKRYLKGGDRAVRKAEKQRAKREAILSDRKKLYKHRNEFTKEEIDKAMARFSSQDALRMQMNAEKEAKRHDRAELKRSKIEYKKLKLQQKQMSEQEKQAKLSTEQKKLETEQKKESADAQAASARWRERVNKAKSIVEFAKVGKDILDDMGITSKEEGESLLGSLATAIGIKDVSTKKAAAELKKQREKAQADWEFETKKMAYEKAKEEFADRAAKKQRQEAMDELKRRQEEAKTKTAEYNANNPGKGGKGGSLTADDIEDILKKYGVI